MCCLCYVKLCREVYLKRICNIVLKLKLICNVILVVKLLGIYKLYSQYIERYLYLSMEKKYLLIRLKIVKWEKFFI